MVPVSSLLVPAWPARLVWPTHPRPPGARRGDEPSRLPQTSIENAAIAKGCRANVSRSSLQLLAQALAAQHTPYSGPIWTRSVSTPRATNTQGRRFGRNTYSVLRTPCRVSAMWSAVPAGPKSACRHRDEASPSSSFILLHSSGARLP